MNKRILSLLMVAVLAILALVPAVLAEEEGFDPGYFYVYTENGKSLNVRNSPGGGDVVGGDPLRVQIRCLLSEPCCGTGAQISA